MSQRRLHVLLSVVVLGGVIFAIVYEGHLRSRIDSGLTSEHHPYGVSADHPESVRVGMEILKRGGNAVDAAIAVSYALGVVEPFGSGLGGGGLMVVHPNRVGEAPQVFDYKETAPMVGSTISYGVGVPGFVRGMEFVHDAFGTLPMRDLIQPSISLSEDGFEVGGLLTRRLQDASHRLDVHQIPHFFPKGRPIQPGHRLEQRKLAAVLKGIQKKGSSFFYESPIALHISDASLGLRIEDMKEYRPLQTRPLISKIDEYEMVTVPAPGGGPMLVQFLLMVEALRGQVSTSAKSIEMLGNIQHGVDDIRRTYMGDPRFVDVPITKITSRVFVDSYLRRMHSREAYEGPESSDVEDEEGDGNTTHFVIVDQQGMMVSCTNTLNNFFGSGIYTEGFFLNSKLSSFSKMRQSPNRSEPGKRAVTFTAPTIFTKNGKPILGIGSSGGARITFVLGSVIIRHLFHHEPLQQAITQPRFYVKDRHIYSERQLPDRLIQMLQKKGYRSEVKPAGVFYGGVQAIRVHPESRTLEGGCDFRRDGVFRVSN